jgi:hypothetical protein
MYNHSKFAEKTRASKYTCPTGSFTPDTMGIETLFILDFYGRERGTKQWVNGNGLFLQVSKVSIRRQSNAFLQNILNFLVR